jgi:hypothetical protein
MKSQALKDELKDAGQAYDATFVYSTDSAHMFQKGGMAQGISGGVSTGIHQISFKRLSNPSKVIS